MTEFVAILGAGKGTWSQVQPTIEEGRFEKAIIFTNQFGKEKYLPNSITELIVLDFEKPVEVLTIEIYSHLKPKIQGIEVCINMVSGTGKEHMALLAAVMKLGIGFRLVTITNKGFEEL
jgi:hypothetical protein